MLSEILNDVRPGEHMLPGVAGHISVLIAFATAIVAAFAYYKSSVKLQSDTDKASWLSLARVFYIIHTLSVISIGVCLFSIIQSHYYEYFYAWDHSSNTLQPKYLLACFWEGQEGSFLLWTFWNAILGIILIRTAKSYEPKVMMIFSIVQIFLASMLIGVYVFGYHLGSSPFVLLRHQMSQAPIFARQDYMQFVKEGNGLNPLLQNYWMVIHPPTLFLGFASTLVPFAFAITSLWDKEYVGWIKQVQVWSLFSMLILGTGIMMGAAWAYESLNFGGYWAWDPVENASLVPWLTLVAGVHTLIVFKHTGYALRATYAFLITTFVLVLYSTFLTRSGILGKTSVHAFTDLGMSGQLLVYMLSLTIPAVVLLAVRWRKLPAVAKEEDVSSREFWMFIGAIVLFLSSLHLTVATSLPVINKIMTWGGQLFNKSYEANYTIVNNIEHYNKFQLPIALLIALLSTVSLFMRFKTTDMKNLSIKMILPLLISIGLTVGACIAYNLTQVAYIALLWCGIFSVVANTEYFIVTLKGKLKLSGAAISHLGFGLVLMGILISSAKQRVISENRMGIDFGSGFDAKAKRENILLYKNVAVPMNDYMVTYIGDSLASPNHYYKVSYVRGNEHFVLYPNAQINPKMGLVANPDTKHYLFKDIYTHVTSVPDHSQNDKADKHFKQYVLKDGDTIYTAKYFVEYEKLRPNNTTSKVPDIQQGDLAVEALLHVKNLHDSLLYTATPVYLISGADHSVSIFDDINRDLGLTFRFSKIDPDTHNVTIEVAESAPDPDYIIMKAIVFPQINLLWLGVIIALFGILVSMIRKLQKMSASNGK